MILDDFVLEKGGNGLKMESARDLITFVDRNRVHRRLTQSELAEQAGYNDGGVQYRRMYTAMDCKLSTAMKYIQAEGYGLYLVKLEGKE